MMGRPKTPWLVRAQEEQAARARAPELLAQDIAGLSPEGLAALQRIINEDLARRDFAEFCRQAWHVNDSTTVLRWNWHHDLVCRVLQGMFEDWEQGQKDANFKQKVVRAIFNLPPGSTKSRIISVAYMCWIWARDPSVRFICLSVNEAAALRDARAAREILRSPWYQETFHPQWTIKADQDATSNFGNSAGGERLSRASGSEIVGLRGSVLILDDPNNPLESENKVERDKVNMLWDTNQRSRINDPERSLVIDVQQRTHEEDLTGHLLKVEGHWDPVANPRGWLQVALPGEFEPERRCITPWGADPRKHAGESIHPKRFSQEWLAKERALFPEQFAGQWQQRPTQAGGGTIQTKWFGWFRLERGVRDDVDDQSTGRARPIECLQPNEAEAVTVKAQHHRPGHWEFDSITITVDPANQKTESGSNWGILVIGQQGPRSFVLDDGTRRGDWAEILDEVLVPLIRIWMPDRLLVEAKAAGPSLLTGFRKALEDGVFRKESVDFARVVVETVTPDAGGGKEDRVKSIAPYLKNGLVLLRDGAPWLGEFIGEMALFPKASRDDRVDALSQYLAHQMVEQVTMPDW